MSLYWRNVGSVLTGTVASQIVPLVGSLVLVRQYPPNEFGTFATWLGACILLGVLLTGRFEAALAAVPDGEARRLAMLSTLATSGLAAGASSIFCCIGFWLFSGYVVELSPVMLILLIPTALAIAAVQTWQSWAAAEGKYRQLTSIRIAQAGAITMGQIGLGVVYPSANGLAFAHFGGVLVGVALAIYLMPPGLFPKNKSIKTISIFWRQFYRFPMLSLPADLINTAAAQLPIFIVANRFGTESAGLLAMAMRILGAPIGLLGVAVLDVFKRHAAASFRARGECREEYIKTFLSLTVGAVVFWVFMTIFSETLFTIVFGNNWQGAGAFAFWLMPLFVLRLIASPLSYTIYLANKQHFDLIWQILLLTMTVITLNIFQHEDAALQAYVTGYGLLYVIYIAMSFQFSIGSKK